MQKNVALGLSGGVDSAVAGAMLLEQGYDVTGVFILCYSGPGCRSDQDRKDALDVALKLGIPFEVLDYRQEFQEKVMEYFKDEYANGRTPNPDVLCNKEIKFGLFYDWAIEQKGFEYIATGHYARIQRVREIPNSKFKNPNFKPQTNHKLLRGVDEKKDQSYFLYQIRQEQLPHILFPIGDMTKFQVREKASELKLSVAGKADSVGICFVGEVSVPQFLKTLGIEEKRGKVVRKTPRSKSQISNNQDFEVIGEHNGVWFYTIGQRHGFTVETQAPDSEPLYVIGKNIMKNLVVVGSREEAMRSRLTVENLKFKRLDGLKNVKVRIRHGGRLVRAEVKAQNSKVKVRLAEPVFGLAPGQAAVFYRGEELVGGGVIV